MWRGPRQWMWPQSLPSQFCLATTGSSRSEPGELLTSDMNNKTKAPHDQRWSFGFFMTINKIVARQGGGKKPNPVLFGCTAAGSKSEVQLLWCKRRTGRRIFTQRERETTASCSGKSGRVITMDATLPNTDLTGNLKPLAGLPLRREQLQQLDPQLVWLKKRGGWWRNIVILYQDTSRQCFLTEWTVVHLTT